jgi:hypothetical protein
LETIHPSETSVDLRETTQRYNPRDRIIHCDRCEHLKSDNNLILGFEVLTAVVMKSSIFWHITSCSSLKVNRHFGGTYYLHLQGQRISQEISTNETLFVTCFMLVSCLAYSSTLKMEVICSSETSVDFQRITWRYIPEESRNSAVRIVSLEGRVVGVRVPLRSRIFSSPRRPDQFWGPPSLLSKGYRGEGSFPGGNAAGA